MKRLFFILGFLIPGVLISMGFFLELGRKGLPAYNPDNLIRLHIIANSDAPADQQLKYEVRDALLARLGHRLASSHNIHEARSSIMSNLSVIEEVAQEEVERQGNKCPVRTVFGRFKFPTRAYGDTVLPAGEYEAVKVIIGAGEGENWWCVLFPPLCLIDVATERVGDSSDLGLPVMTVPVYSQSVEVRFRLLELWQASRQRLATIFNNL